MPAIVVEQEGTAETGAMSIETFEPQFRFRTYKNVVAIGVAFLLQFTAFNGMQNLQSSLNTEANIGVNSSSIIYVFLIVSSIFLPHPLMSIFGLKWTLVMSQIPSVDHHLCMLHTSDEWVLFSFPAMSFLSLRITIPRPI